MKKRVGRWPKREELLRNGFREEIGLPMTDAGHRVVVKRAVQVVKRMADRRWGERLENDSEANIKIFWKEVKRVRKGEQVRDVQLTSHYANICHMKPLQSDRCIIRCRLFYPIDHTLTPFSPQNTNHVINNIKNSPATGPDFISNFHLKHGGPHEIQDLSPVFGIHGKSSQYLNQINKDPTTHFSHRPITLLCTPSKITERLKLNIIHPDVPLAPTQHGFRPLHSTNILLTKFTQHILNGISLKRPAQRTPPIYISKAFDAIPRHRLTDKLYNTNLHNNIKRWLANYSGGRQSHVLFNGKSSRRKKFSNGVPLGPVLSPALFNIYMHHTPTTPANINIMSYADDFSITSTHNDIPTATTQLQGYLKTIQTWFDRNRLKVAPTKSMHNHPPHQLQKRTSTHTTTNTR